MGRPTRVDGKPATICGMKVPVKNSTTELARLYSRFLDRQSAEWRDRLPILCRARARFVERLKKRGICSTADLTAQLSRLSPSQKFSGIDLICILKIRRAIPVLLELMLEKKCDRGLIFACADAIGRLGAGRRATQAFVEIGKRELESTDPDRHWLEVVILGLGRPDDPPAVEILVRIFERTDLPGWVRGDAADKLGGVGLIGDRRTTWFQRCRATAIRGLTDDSIEVQFGSMYLISQLASSYTSRNRRKDTDKGLESTLPRLRQIAATDHRLAPRHWWPMSGEAEDTIGSITGNYPELDAGERWQPSNGCGESNRD